MGSSSRWNIFKRASSPSPRKAASPRSVTHRINGASEEWVQGERLGSGGYGQVHLHRSRDARSGYSVRAVKSITHTAHRGAAKAVKRELNALIALRKYTDHFVDFYGWYEAVADGGNARTVFIAMEYLPAGDLHRYMLDDPALAKENCKIITRQLLLALQIMHQNNICHRDLKPQNVLLASVSPLKLKLADFGIAKCTSQDASLMQTAIGSSKYIAPEVLRLNPHVRPGQAYNQAVDMWALGTLAHEIMTGSVPFCDYETGSTTTDEDDDDDDDDDGEDGEMFGLAASSRGSSPHSAEALKVTMNLMELGNYCSGSTPFPLAMMHGRLAYSTIFKDFILCALYPDPGQRLSATRALQHPWINENVPYSSWYDGIIRTLPDAHASAERTDANDTEGLRRERANARLLGLSGVFRAARQFRRAVPRKVDTEGVAGSGESRRGGDARRSVDQGARAEAERLRRELARARLLGLSGVFRAARQFRRAVPRDTEGGGDDEPDSY